MIKIMLADDHHIVRKGLRALLSNEKDFEIIGEASNGLEAIELAKSLKPDILVLDLMMPGINGLEVTARLTKSCPQIRIIILSMQSNEAYVYEAIRSGAMAYILKDNTTDELTAAIRQVDYGSRYLSSSIKVHSVQEYNVKADTDALDPLSQLTVREKEILNLIIRGWCNSDIASKLGISQRTVETHCLNFMHKLDICNRGQLIQFAIQNGIISPNDLLVKNQ